MKCKERVRGFFFSRVIVALVISVVPSFPQVPTGTIEGAVLDQSEAVIEDAKVTVVNRETGALRSTNWIVGGPKGAAARLGMKRTTLQTRMQKLGIAPVRSAVASARC